MKKILYLTLIMSCAFSTVQSATDLTVQSTPQNNNAASSYLATRLAWLKYPQPQYQSDELEQHDRSAIVRVHADQYGKIIAATIQESSGLDELDQKLLTAVTRAQIKPSIQNGVAINTIGYQTFSFKLNDAADQKKPVAQCYFSFESKNWQRQQKNKSVPFEYLQQPQLNLNAQLFPNKVQRIKFKFKVSAQGDITQVKLKKKTGIATVDQAVIDAVSKSQVNVEKTLWLYKKSTLEDQIEFNAQDCA